jgi:iron complex outermembrane recepter protein
VNRNIKISAAIKLILAACVGVSRAAEPGDASANAPPALSEVVVTAQRRVESAQDVPITIQALTAETLNQLNATTLDDYIKFLPNVTTAGSGPGQSNLYMRGLAIPIAGNQGSGSVGFFPNVAVYLDDQSVQLPGRNLDVYAADLERIEVLEGPQGTLFGAGAEAGVVRYITNKPKLNVVEANFDGGYATTAHGDPSNNLTAMLNVPLIPDTLAVRAVIYDDHRGGYINNIPATFVRSNSDLGISYAGGAVPPNSPTLSNAALAGSAINPVTYQGIRASVLWQINDDWNALITQSYQDMDAEGQFAEETIDAAGHTLPDLSIEQYNPSWDKDRFENTSWTLSGKLGDLRAIYTGGYLVRNIEQIQDYTNYARGVYADYYQCYPGKCFSPSTNWFDVERNTHQSHEFRLSTPDDWRLRAIGGLFWEKYQIQELVDFNYKAQGAPFSPVGPPTGYDELNGQIVSWGTPGETFVPYPVTTFDANLIGPQTAFFDDVTRGYTQRAAFGSVDFDIVPKTLTLTAGTRYYSVNTTEVGSSAGSFGCQLQYYPDAPDPCINHSNFANLNAEHLDTTYSGFRSRANLSWKVTRDALLYYTWSQGYRPGGFNRTSNAPESTSPLYGIFVTPIAFKPDTLTNNEAGWKTEWLEHRLMFDGAIYQEDWKNTQITVFDPGITGNQIFTTNGPNYRVRGLETQLQARVTAHLTVAASAAWNTSKLVKEVNFVDTSGNPIIWSNYTNSYGQPLRNPFGQLGDPLAQCPPFEGNLRLRYDAPFGAYEWFVQVDGTHQAHSYASTDRLSRDLQGNSEAYDDPGFSTYDASMGISRDAWQVKLYGENITDTRAQLYANYAQWFKAVTINRPRTIGMQISYKFRPDAK